MRLLTGTAATQGRRANDYCWTIEGELVMFGVECDGAQPDDACGCGRGMAGMESHKATTTMKVVDLPLSIEELAAKVRLSLQDGGWMLDATAREVSDLIAAHTAELLRVGSQFAAGTVIERRGGKLQVRSAQSAAS